MRGGTDFLLCELVAGGADELKFRGEFLADPPPGVLPNDGFEGPPGGSWEVPYLFCKVAIL